MLTAKFFITLRLALVPGLFEFDLVAIDMCRNLTQSLGSLLLILPGGLQSLNFILVLRLFLLFLKLLHLIMFLFIFRFLLLNQMLIDPIDHGIPSLRLHRQLYAQDRGKHALAL